MLADAMRSSPRLIWSMTQSRSGKICNGLVAISRPAQICRPCARLHDANFVTRGARLRSWMEGWRVTCPVCGATLEDFRLYTRLFRADPADPWLEQNADRARDGEKIIDRASRKGGKAAHAILMRSLLCSQAPKTRANNVTVAMPRLLDLVVEGSEEFFQSLAPENWSSNSRLLPLSVRIPVLAGIATVSRKPEYWVDRLVGAAVPSRKAGLFHAIRSIESASPTGRATTRC
jgi:hypothetical protein